MKKYLLQKLGQLSDRVSKEKKEEIYKDILDLKLSESDKKIILLEDKYQGAFK